MYAVKLKKNDKRFLLQKLVFLTFASLTSVI